MIFLRLSSFDIECKYWTRGQKIGQHKSDVGMAWDLGTLGPGDYTLVITMSEQGNPWVNTSELVYTIEIAQTTVL